jgi:mannose-6-phosphate isomerase-like protein (cupin superfamily)
MSFEPLFGGAGRGFVVPHANGAPIELPGWSLRIKVAASDTAGHVTLLEGVMDAGHAGPLPHVHGRHDEAFFLLEGSLHFRVGGARRVVSPGETVFASRGLAHGFANPGTTQARYLCMLTPSGYEFYFDRLAALIRALGAPPDRATLLRLMAEYETFPVDDDGKLLLV